MIDFIVNNEPSDIVASLHGQRSSKMTYNMYVNDSAAVANPLTK